MCGKIGPGLKGTIPESSGQAPHGYYTPYGNGVPLTSLSATHFQWRTLCAVGAEEPRPPGLLELVNIKRGETALSVPIKVMLIKTTNKYPL